MIHDEDRPKGPRQWRKRQEAGQARIDGLIAAERTGSAIEDELSNQTGYLPAPRSSKSFAKPSNSAKEADR